MRTLKQGTTHPIANQTVLALAGKFGQIAEYGPKPVETDVFRAVYPMFNPEAYGIIMDNYRRHVDEYNMRTEWENVDIHNFNQNVELYLKHRATDMQKGYAVRFPELNSELIRTREYNEAADQANEKYGPIIKKRPHHIIKPVTEQYFQNFLHVYNTQLQKHNEPQMERSIRTPRPLPPLKVNSRFITQLRRAEGMFSLKVCSKSVRTHRQHLEAADIFVNSKFRGRQMAVEVEINPQILVIFDLHGNKLTRAKNQSVTTERGKTLPDINDITRASKEEYKEKNDASQSFDKVSAEPTAVGYTSTSNMVTGSNQGISPGAAAPKVLNVRLALTKKFRQMIMHPQELAEKLAIGDYNEYTPIPLADLVRIAYDGLLTSDEYRELVIQDLLKQSAKIWIGTTPFPGSWKIAVNLWMKYKFLNFKGNSMNPTNIADYLPEYRWRLEQARRWFLRGNVTVKPLYPSKYFDPTRKQTNEIGFEGTAKMWQRKKNGEEKDPIDNLKLEKESKQRKKRLSNNSKFNTEIERYMNGRTTQSKLWDYVAQNLPPEFLTELPKILQKKLAARTAAQNQ